MTVHPSPATASCCEEYAGASRRGFLRGMVGLGAASLAVSYGDAFTETSYAATGTASQVLVVLSMRGAADGLSLVVPHGDPVYYTARPGIAVPKERLLAADAMFGLHPCLKPLLPLWSAGKMGVVHATGQPVTTRSHFAAMEQVEDADPGSSARTGWLNRLVGRNGTGSPLTAIQMGGGPVATHLVGSHPSMVAADVDSLRLAGPEDPESERARRSAMATMWADAPGALGSGGRSAIRVADEFKTVRSSSAKPAHGASYPPGDLGDALAATARTIRADVGAEVVTVDHGSWDHHNWIGSPDSGNLQRMADEFAGAVAAFFTDLGGLADKVTVVTISEFGRRVVENANRGVDHGHGNVMFAFGAGVKGGRYLGRWPGLEATVDADLAVTTDYRSVLSEVVRSRFGVVSSTVFPSFVPETVGLMAGL